MIERESRLPLMLGSLVAVLLHTALVPVWGISLDKAAGRLPVEPPKQDQPLPEPAELEVGQARNPVTNIAWIAYDDYRELLAKHSIVEQPALQNQQDPTPNAPFEIDPTPPAPNTPLQVNPTPPQNDSADQASASAPVSPAVNVPLPKPTERGDIPFVPQGPMPPDAVAAAENAPDPADQPADRATEAPQKKPAAQASPDSSAKPTAAPRDEAESPPVTILPGSLRIQPGKVETYLGVEIITVLPRPKPAAYFSAVPRNPKATLWFNNQGIVTHVELTRDTGAKNWDDPVITAFEQWKARGDKIDNLQGEIRLNVELLLVGE